MRFDSWSSWAMLVLLGGLGGCEQSVPTSPPDTAPALAGASSDPVVSSADPAAAPRDTTIDVRVLGSGFDNGSKAVFLLDGVAVPGVTTNRTSYRTSKELVANVTIAADATPERYDIQVTTSSGKKGIGTEKFEVLDLVSLGSLGGAGSRAFGINNLGQIAGNGTRADGTSAPFVWSAGAMHELPLPAGWTGAAYPDVDDAGIVSGTPNDGTMFRAVRWLPSGGSWTMEVLATLAGYEGGETHTRAANAAGDIVGLATKPGLPTRVVVWRAGVPTAIDLSASVTRLSVWDISSAGWITGDGDVSGGHSAFVWRPDGSGIPGRGITIVLARYGSGSNSGKASNRSGMVVGYMYDSRKSVALRWRPLRSDPVQTSDYVLEALSGANATAANIADDGYIVGAQNGSPASWSAAGTLSILPTFSNYRGEPNDVRVIEGRHWVAGEVAVGAYWRASLWRVR